MDLYTEGVRDVAKEMGINVLAEMLDMSDSRLYKKLDPDSGINLTLHDFIRIVKATRDIRCIQAILDDLEITAIPNGAVSAVTGDSINNMLLDKHDRNAEFIRECRASLRDGRIDDFEFKRLRQLRHGLSSGNSTLWKCIEHKYQQDTKIRLV